MHTFFTLYRYELKKLLHQKFLLAGAVIFVAFLAVQSAMWLSSSSAFSDIQPLDGSDVLHGSASMAYQKALWAEYHGELTDERIGRLAELAGGTAPGMFFDYRDFEYLPGYGYVYDGESISGFAPKLRDNFHETWSMTRLILNENHFAFGLFLLLALSPIYAGEYMAGTAQLLVSSKHGKTTASLAKAAAAVTVVTATTLLFCLGVLLVCAACFGGFTGWETDIQVDYDHVLFIPVRMNHLQFFLFQMGMNALAGLGTAALASLCSVLLRSTSFAMVVSGALYAGPWFLQEVIYGYGTFPLFRWMFVLPVWLADTDDLLLFPGIQQLRLLPVVEEMPVWGALFTAVSVPLLFFGAYRVFDSRPAVRE